MRPTFFTLLTLAALAGIGPVHAADWNVVAEQSSLRFSGVSQGESFEGHFSHFSPAIRFDPSALDQARFDVAIDLASADSRNEERDDTLMGSDFFDVERFPEARFLAEEFVSAADGGFEARGTLSLRGVSKPVTLVFTWTPIEGGARLDGSATLDRIAFGVGGSEDWTDPETIAHEIEVATTLVLRTP